MAADRSRDLSRRVTVRVDPKWVASFRKSGMRLCCSFGVKTNAAEAAEFNVIAWAETPTPINTITFVDQYLIAAGKHGIEDGATVAPNTEPIPIRLGESFTVQSDWTTAQTTLADSPSPHTIRFLPVTSASAILFKYVRNVITPFFVADMDTSPLPPGKYALEPTGDLLLFFMPQEAPTAFKFLNVPTEHYSFRFHGQPASTILYNNEGKWELLGTGNVANLADGADIGSLSSLSSQSSKL